MAKWYGAPEVRHCLERDEVLSTTCGSPGQIDLSDNKMSCMEAGSVATILDCGAEKSFINIFNIPIYIRSCFINVLYMMDPIIYPRPTPSCCLPLKYLVLLRLM